MLWCCCLACGCGALLPGAAGGVLWLEMVC